jgi:hypothetical protein
MKNFRIWKILQSLYLPIFNAGVVGMVIFDKQDFPRIYHTLALGITITIFVGAIHEFLGIFCGLAYDLIQLIRLGLRRVANIPERTE